MLLGVANACSVYSRDLSDDAAVSVTRSGRDAVGAGRGGGGVGEASGGGDAESANAGQASSVSGSAGAGTRPCAGTGGATASAGGAARSGNSATPGVGGDAGGDAGIGPSLGGGSPILPPGDLLDGFEDEDLTLEPTDGRGGVWYLFDDGTVGSVGPTPLVCSPLVGAPPELGMYAMHVTATGFSGFGSGLGVDFRDGKKVYDGAKYTGFRFWARVGDGKNTHHRIQIADATTEPAGGKCNAAASAPDGQKCNDHFGINKTFTTSWARYSIRFDELTQVGWGNAAPTLDRAALYGLQVTAKAKLEVDLWLDQIEFF